MRGLTTFANELIEALQDAGAHPYAYSGRCMYGKQCVAIDTDSLPEFIEVLLHVSVAHPEIGHGTLSRVSSDSMGLGAVWYWQAALVMDASNEDTE